MSDELDRRITEAIEEIAAGRPAIAEVRFPDGVGDARFRRRWPAPVVALGAFTLAMAAAAVGFLIAKAGDDSIPVATTPAPQVITLSAADGAPLGGVLYQAGDTGVVLGTAYGWDAVGLAPIAEPLAEAGITVLVVELRGTGSSPGETDVDKIPADLAGGVAFLDDMVAGEVFLMGFSHSATGALVAAGRDGVDVAGVAAMMPFPQYQGLDARSVVGEIAIPLHLVGASQDSILSSAGWALELFTAAGEPKTIEILPPLGEDAGYMSTYGPLMADSMLIFIGGV
jgi:dienelactone hydrolase